MTHARKAGLSGKAASHRDRISGLVLQPTALIMTSREVNQYTPAQNGRYSIQLAADDHAMSTVLWSMIVNTARNPSWG